MRKWLEEDYPNVQQQLSLVVKEIIHTHLDGSNNNLFSKSTGKHERNKLHTLLMAIEYIQFPGKTA